MGDLSSCGFLLDVVHLTWSIWTHLTGQIWMTLRTLSIMNSCCSRTQGLAKVKGTEVIEAFGLSNAYYIPSR